MAQLIWICLLFAFPHFPYYPSALPDAGTLLRVFDFKSFLALHIYHMISLIKSDFSRPQPKSALPNITIFIVLHDAHV